MNTQEERESERVTPALISITPATPLASLSRECLVEEEEDDEEESHKADSGQQPPIQLSQSWAVFGDQAERHADRADSLHSFSKSDSHLAARLPAARVL